MKTLFHYITRLLHVNETNVNGTPLPFSLPKSNWIKPFTEWIMDFIINDYQTALNCSYFCYIAYAHFVVKRCSSDCYKAKPFLDLTSGKVLMVGVLPIETLLHCSTFMSLVIVISVRSLFIHHYSHHFNWGAAGPLCRVACCMQYDVLFSARSSVVRRSINYCDQC